MYRVFDQLPADEAQLAEHVKALAAMATQTEHQSLFDHLYECLTILDQKSASLLAFNSIITAVFAIFMTASLEVAEWVVVNLGMMSVLVSSLLLLSVVWVHWSTTEDLRVPADHSLVLLGVRRTRTIRYRLAWYCSVISVLSLTFFIVLRMAQSLFF